MTKLSGSIEDCCFFIFLCSRSHPRHQDLQLEIEATFLKFVRGDPGVECHPAVFLLSDAR